MKILLLYLAMANLTGGVAVLIDKRRAQRGGWRIRERTLFLFALLGGTPGVYLSMRMCRHKTKHRRFMWGLPLIFLAQLAAIGAAGYYWYTRFGFPSGHRRGGLLLVYPFRIPDKITISVKGVRKDAFIEGRPYFRPLYGNGRKR